jgi:hypothetical protein
MAKAGSSGEPGGAGKRDLAELLLGAADETQDAKVARTDLDPVVLPQSSGVGSPQSVQPKDLNLSPGEMEQLQKVLLQQQELMKVQMEQTKALLKVMMRSQQPAAPETVAVAAAAAAAEAVQKNKEKKLPEEAEKELQKVARKFEGDIRKLVRARRQREKVSSDVDFYLADKSGERYPPGTRPFGVSESRSELMQPWSHSVSTDYEMKFTIPKGTTRRDAMKLVHYMFGYVFRDSKLREIHCESIRLAYPCSFLLRPQFTHPWGV